MNNLMNTIEYTQRTKNSDDFPGKCFRGRWYLLCNVRGKYNKTLLWLAFLIPLIQLYCDTKLYFCVKMKYTLFLLLWYRKYIELFSLVKVTLRWWIILDYLKINSWYIALFLNMWNKNMWGNSSFHIEKVLFPITGLMCRARAVHVL